MHFSGSVHTRGRRWVRWARVLIVGMVGGGIQIFLLLATGLSLPPQLAGLPLHWPLGLVGALSACSYLVLALLEGFLATSRSGTIAAGRAAGRLVGGISALAVAIAIVVLAVIILYTPLPPLAPGQIDRADLRSELAVLLCLFAMVEGVWAWGVSMVGGWIGGVVGQRAASRSIQSSLPGATTRR